MTSHFHPSITAEYENNEITTLEELRILKQELKAQVKELEGVDEDDEDYDFQEDFTYTEAVETLAWATNLYKVRMKQATGR